MEEQNTTFSIKELLLKPRETKKRATERGDLLDSFLIKINKERIGTKFKPMEMKVLAINLARFSVEQLYELKSNCLDYERRKGSYSKCLFGSLKVDK